MNKFFGLLSALFLGTILGYLIFNKDNSDQSNFEIEGNYSTKTNKAIKPPIIDNKIRVFNKLDFTKAADLSLNAVVHIKVSSVSYNNYYRGSVLDYFFNREKSPSFKVGFGSGVIVDKKGYIITNNHVIENSDKIEVILHDKRTYEAKMIGRDPTTDLAVLKVKENNLSFLNFGNSDKVKIGEWVLAVGNPFNLSSTVTAGIVSAKARNINLLNEISGIEAFIQTDAVINSGNSGGALVDTKGNLIGINTAIQSTTGVYNGYSFAIPSNIAKKIYTDIIEFGMVQRAFLGVNVTENNSYIAKSQNFKTHRGVVVSGVSKRGAAKKAGITSGDIILEINNKKTKTFSELQEVVSQYRPGDNVSVKIIRKNKELNYKLTLTDIYGNVAPNYKKKRIN